MPSPAETIAGPAQQKSAESRFDGEVVSNFLDNARYQFSPRRLGSGAAMCLVTALFGGLLALWFYFDHGWPYWDAASHVLDAFKYRDLLSHPRLLSGDWWHRMLTVNYCYPPQVHAFNGLLKVLFGNGLFSDHLSLLLFCGLLNISTFKIAERLFQSRLTAFICAMVINCTPLAICISHLPLLDYPHMALYSAAMLTMLWWNEKPSWRRSLAFGNVLGLAVCAKQIASFFLFLPCLALLASFLWKRQHERALKLTASGGIATVWLMTWILPNFQAMRGFTVRNNLAAAGQAHDLIAQNFLTYLCNIPVSLSPLLTVIFGVTLLFAMRRILSRTWLFALSAISGICMLASMSFQIPEDRYMAPAFVWFALVSGYGLSKAIRMKSMQFWTVGIALTALVFLQFVAFSFTPYPISAPILVNLPRELALDKGNFSYKADSHTPVPPGDPWGQDWVINLIQKTDGNVPTWLCIMPNDACYNVHTFSLIAAEKKCPVQATTMRVFTMSGEEVNDTTSSIMYYHWYLFTSNMHLEAGGGVSMPKDDASVRALRQAENFVSHSSKFYLAGQHRAPDGTIVSLYRQR